MFHTYKMKAGHVTLGCVLPMLANEVWAKNDDSHSISLPGCLFLLPRTPGNKGCSSHFYFWLFFTLSTDLQLSSLCSTKGKVESDSGKAHHKFDMYFTVSFTPYVVFSLTWGNLVTFEASPLLLNLFEIGNGFKIDRQVGTVLVAALFS